MKNYTKIPNEILEQSQLSVSARYLYCVLLKYCGKDERCFPRQKTLSKALGYSERHIRSLLNELIKAGIISKRRRGWNRANIYTVSKSLEIDRKSDSYQLGPMFPFHQGIEVPPKSTYLKGKGKRSVKGLEKLREDLTNKNIVKNNPM